EILIITPSPSPPAPASLSLPLPLSEEGQGEIESSQQSGTLRNSNDTEPKVWVIEISIRQSLSDEYAVPVPSPAYCDYRLPGYEDVIAGHHLVGPTAHNVSSLPSTLSSYSSMRGSAAVPVQRRYSGPPPAYESDSENDSENDEDDDDEQEEVNNQDSTSGEQAAITTTAGSGINSQRPIEMTAVMVSSSPVSGRRISLIRTGASTVADRVTSIAMTSTTTTIATATASDIEQDSIMSSSGSLLTLQRSDASSVTLALADKEESSISTVKEE
ncbi:hypothetical protein BGZ65_007766, partial [Modicella reniformis]